MDKKGKNAAGKGGGTIVDVFDNRVNFKFVNCELGNLENTNVFYVFNCRFEEIFYAHC
jgi:hypothetical protein